MFHRLSIVAAMLTVAGCYRAVEVADSDTSTGDGGDASAHDAATPDGWSGDHDGAADAGVPCHAGREICNGFDDDCDGLVDEDPEASTWCGARCGIDECPRARALTPLANTLLTSQQPTFQWELLGGADAARVELCRDPDCTAVIATVTGTTAATLAAPLPRGPVFWRLVPRRAGRDLPAVSEPWILRVPSVSAGSSASGTTGTVIDVDADGWSDVIVSTVRAGPVDATDYVLFTGSATGLIRRFQLPPPVGIVCLEDFDGDGHTDAYGGQDPPAPGGPAGLLRGAPSDLLGPGAGPLPPALERPPHNWYDALGDVDHDGYPDLYDYHAASATSPAVPNAIAGGGPGGLQSATASVSVPPYTEAGFPSQVYPVGDLDADGIADFVALQGCGYDGTNLVCPSDASMWCIHGGVGGFAAPRPCARAPRIPAPYTDPGGVPEAIRATGDLDGDGLVDLVARLSGVEGEEFDLLLLQRDASPDRYAWTLLETGWIGPGCDLDGDGAGDLVGGAWTSPSLADTFVVRGGPDGPRSERIHLSGLAAVATRCLGDGDGDGLSEFAVLLYDPSTHARPDTADNYVLHVYRGTPTGVDPTPVQVIPIGRARPWLL